MPKSETIYVPMSPGVTARVEIQIVVDPSCPTPNEMPTRRAPSVSELHDLSEKLIRRAYQFHPEH